MSDTFQPPPELFARHTTALRALALELLRDAHAADDAVQETWVRFARARPREGEGLGGWLTTVLRRLVSNQRRDEARRREREQASARNERVEAERNDERQAALEALVAAVGELDEPLRTVVMLRWFEGLPPRAIAQRLGLEPQAVHQRLHRAHAKLRERLERELGPDRRYTAALALLVGRDAALPTAASIGVLTGAWLMGVKSAAALAAGVVVLFAWLAWRSDRASAKVANPDAHLPQLEASAEAARGATPSPASGEDSQRVGVSALPAEDAAPAAWEAPTHEFELEVVVTDSYDLPAPGQTVLGGPLEHALNSIGETDRDGVCRVKWRAFNAAMPLLVGLEDNALTRLEVYAGKQRVALRVGQQPKAAPSVAAREFTEVNGAGAPEGVVEARLLSNFFAQRESHPNAQRDHDGWTTFVDPQLALMLGPADIVGASEALNSALSEVGFSARVAYLEVSGIQLVPSQWLRIEGRASAADGSPLERGMVLARRVDGADWQGVSTEADGSYRLDGLEPGEWEVVAWHSRLGRTSARLHGLDGQALRWDPQLERGAVLVGRLTGPQDQPLPDWRVQVLDAQGDPPFVDEAATDAEGRFEIPNAPNRPLQVFVGPPTAAGAGLRPLAEWLAPREAPHTTRISAADLEPAAEFRVQVRSLPTSGAHHARLRVQFLESGRVLELRPVGITVNEGSATVDFAFEAPQSAPLALELREAGALARELAGLTAHAGAPNSLEVAATAPQARLQLARELGGGELTLRLRGRHVEVSSGPLGVPGGVEVGLPAGAWLVRLEHEGRSVLERLELEPAGPPAVFGPGD